MKQKLMLMAGMLSAVMIFAGCSSTPIPNHVEPGITNRANVVNAVGICLKNDYSKDVFVKMDDSVKDHQYAGEVKAYTENALKYLNFNLKESEKEAKSIITVKFDSTAAKRMTVRYFMAATEDGKDAWNVISNCTSAIEDIRPFLPGLVAGAIPCVGTQKRSVTNVNKYPGFLIAVMGSPEKQQ